MTGKTARRWLLFVHQLPSTPSNLRVRTWRRLQQLGAIPVKQAVYALPDSPTAREDFEWLKTEIKGAGGDASVFAADSVDAWSDDALVEEFRRSRQEAYTALARDVERVLARLTATRRPRGTRAPAARRLLEVFRQRVTAIEHIDFFGSAGRDQVTTLLKQLEEKSSDPSRPAVSPRATGAVDVHSYAGRVWVTRPRPGVDRMASAWLIKRFVDPQARFGFAADRESLPQNVIPFDMFGVDFSHQGEGCTFETLCAVFGIQEPAVVRVAAIVHDLDLKDGRFGAPEAPTVGTVIEGLHLSISEDDALLAQGMTLIESLYCAFEQSTRSAGPRPLARPRNRGRSHRGKGATGRRVR
ncbi:MAG: chromate resistance protein ChrB domain-containing protein [Gemmatimonadaceae bacterium]